MPPERWRPTTGRSQHALRFTVYACHESVRQGNLTFRFSVKFPPVPQICGRLQRRDRFLRTQRLILSRTRPTGRDCGPQPHPTLIDISRPVPKKRTGHISQSCRDPGGVIRWLCALWTTFECSGLGTAEAHRDNIGMLTNTRKERQHVRDN